MLAALGAHMQGGASGKVLGASKLKDLNFKVLEEIHWLFKIAAFGTGRTMKGLFEDCFALWIREHEQELIDLMKKSRSGRR
jgi:hypothetical protein